jgi:CheY-like chemotaxis protein
MPAVLALCSDLFFASRIGETAKAAGVTCTTAGTLEALLAHARAETPRLVIVDLMPRDGDPVASVRALRADPATAGARLIGFYAHEMTELAAAARAAGCETVLTRGVFSRQLPTLLTRP